MENLFIETSDSYNNMVEILYNTMLEQCQKYDITLTEELIFAFVQIFENTIKAPNA